VPFGSRVEADVVYSPELATSDGAAGYWSSSSAS
jgi:hypothetical protein